MSDRYAVLAIQDGNADNVIQELIDCLARIGVGLEYPGTRSVKVLNDVGEQQDVSRGEFLIRLRQRQATTFQWWWNDSEDTCCRVSDCNHRMIVEFWLDGHNDHHERVLLSSLRDLYKSFADRQLAIGFVVDRVGDCALYHWSDILTGATEIPGKFPDEIIVPNGSADHLARRIGDDTRMTSYGESTVFTSSR